jgi:hypothetical protein
MKLFEQSQVASHEHKTYGHASITKEPAGADNGQKRRGSIVYNRNAFLSACT